MHVEILLLPIHVCDGEVRRIEGVCEVVHREFAMAVDAGTVWVGVRLVPKVAICHEHRVRHRHGAVGIDVGTIRHRQVVPKDPLYVHLCVGHVLLEVVVQVAHHRHTTAFSVAIKQRRSKGVACAIRERRAVCQNDGLQVPS